MGTSTGVTARESAASCRGSSRAAEVEDALDADLEDCRIGKGQPARDRSAHGARYSLINSMETAVEDVDIWTPVAQMVGIPIAV
jgi:hypothetical protein